MSELASWCFVSFREKVANSSKFLKAEAPTAVCFTLLQLAYRRRKPAVIAARQLRNTAKTTKSTITTY